MPESSRTVDEAWRDAEALIQRIEQACRSDLAPERIYEELVVGVASSTQSAAVSLWVVDSENRHVLSRCGLDLSLQDEDGTWSKFTTQATTVPQAHWIESDTAAAPGSMTGGRMIAAVRLDTESVMGLSLRLDRVIDAASGQPLRELLQVLIELAMTVYLRAQYQGLRQQMVARRDHETLLGELNDGVGIVESFAAISRVVARYTEVDRVSLLRLGRSRARLIASSTQPRVDRRARQARLLENLAESLVHHPAGVTFVVGDPGTVQAEVRDLMVPYVTESGCREIHLETVRDEDEAPMAALVMERFRLPSVDDGVAPPSISSILPLVQDAIRRAIKRDDGGWSLMVGRLARRSAGQKGAITLLAVTAAALLLWLIPAPLKIPVEGRIQAAQSHALFAPAEGVVREVHLDNGDSVGKGDPIITMRSPALELHQKNLQGDLETARTQLASIGAMRSRSGTSREDQRIGRGSADEQMLKTQIEGLEQQLALVNRQMEALTVISPIDGIVDRWNLKQTLSARPVSHGQYLVDVVSTEQGWSVELDLPDKDIRYVMLQQNREPCYCTFRLSSGDDTFYEGTVERVADVAHLDPRGRSMIRLVVPYHPAEPRNLRVGSSVFAHIHCGNRSLGFVWFRGLIEWARQQTLF